MTQKLTLEEWCNEIYPGKKPSLQTLQRWARNGNFYPAAEKEGREYRPVSSVTDCDFAKFNTVDDVFIERIVIVTPERESP